MLAQPRGLARIAANADVQVVALREDPAVAAVDRGDLDHHRPCETRLVRHVRLERDAVENLAAELERSRCPPVAAVCPDQDPRTHLLPVHRQTAGVDVGDLHPVAHVRSGFGRLQQEEVVEPPALRHQRQRLARASLEPRAVMQPAVETVDDVLDDGVDREREQPRGAARDSAAARLVPREGRRVDEQNVRAGAGEPVRGGRAGGPAANDCDVERAHSPKLQWPLPGVCPSGQRERAVNPSAQPTEVRILPPPLARAAGTAARSHGGNHVSPVGPLLLRTRNHSVVCERRHSRHSPGAAPGQRARVTPNQISTPMNASTATTIKAGINQRRLTAPSTSNVRARVSRGDIRGLGIPRPAGPRYSDALHQPHHSTAVCRTTSRTRSSEARSTHSTAACAPSPAGP